MQAFLLHEIVRTAVRAASGTKQLCNWFFCSSVSIYSCKSNIMDSSCIQYPIITRGADFHEYLIASKLVKNFYDFLQGASLYCNVDDKALLGNDTATEA
jgi:hypothetical protein